MAFKFYIPTLKQAVLIAFIGVFFPVHMVGWTEESGQALEGEYIALDGAPGEEGESLLRVVVTRSGEEGVAGPAPDLLVKLLGVRPGQGVVETLEERTDEEGVAQFHVQQNSEVQYLPQVEVSGFEFTADGILIPGQREEVTAQVPLVSSDSSVVRGVSVWILVEAYEDYLLVREEWLLSSGSSLYVPEEADNEGLRMILPEGAEGIHVITPTEGVTVSDDSITISHPIGANGIVTEESNGLLAIQFSLPNSNQDYLFEQIMPVAIDSLALLIPQRTQFPDLPVLDVSLGVPSCEDSSEAEVVCFPDPLSGLQDWDPIPHEPKRAVVGGRGEAGSVLLFETEGWPVEPKWAMKVTGLLAVFLLFLFLWIWRRKPTEIKRKMSHGQKQKLLQEKQTLLCELVRLRQVYETGQLSVSEFDLQDMVIRGRLNEVFGHLESADKSETLG
jgi:hypothetical protein